MTAHEKISELLALSAAGLLSPDEERAVKSHLHECAECSARAEEFARISSALGRLPAPPTPPFLAARTESRLAAAADGRQGEWLAALAAIAAWGISAAIWSLYALFSQRGLILLAWFFVIAPLLTVPAAAALARRRRFAERSVL